MEELDEGWVILTYEVRCLSLEFLNDKVGTKMAKKEPKFTSGHSYLDPHERLNVIGFSNFRCLTRLPSCGSGFLTSKRPRVLLKSLVWEKLL
jgi:hypothetical protein